MQLKTLVQFIEDAPRRDIPKLFSAVAHEAMITGIVRECLAELPDTEREELIAHCEDYR